MGNGKKFTSAIAVGVIGFAAATGTASARPCEEHVGKERAKCVTQFKRDQQAWPKDPKPFEIKRRVGAYNWAKARRVAICETGFNLNHYPSGTYRGPLGMYVQTQAYGIRKTGYNPPRTWPEHVAVAYASFDITGGWSGWGCGGA